MSDELHLTLEGRPVTLGVRRSRRARRMRLVVEAARGGAVLVLPAGAGERDGRRFVAEHAPWLLRRLAELPQPVPFRDGAVVPYRGVDHVVRHAGSARGPIERGVVWRHGGAIHVAGRDEHLARRIRDWFRHEARDVLGPLAETKAAVLGERPARVTVRDQRTRWGSCSAKGALSFNWRLVMAPDAAIDYVVAHEVAHLVELNHSPSFWRIVDRLTAHREDGRSWLKAHGDGLHRYGAVHRYGTVLAAT